MNASGRALDSRRKNANDAIRKSEQEPVKSADQSSPVADSTGSLQDLRLLFAVDSRFPGYGGAESQAVKLALALRERGALVEFVSPRVDKALSLHEKFQGFDVTRLDYPHIRWLGSLVLMFRFARYLLANRNRYDALHVHITHLLAAAAGYVRRFTHLPVITKISGFYEFEGGVLDHKKRFMPLNFLIRQGLRRVDHVQTISEQTRQKLLQAGFRNTQIKFVPNGIDTRSQPVPAPKAEQLVVGYCGRLRHVKGVHVLLEAAAEVLKLRPGLKLRLSIAGAGGTQAELQAQAHSLGIESLIDWHGRIDDTASFYRAVDVYVQPSFAEGLPNSVLEAMAEQRPVIATRVGGNTDLVEHGVTGLLFEPNNALMLAEQILRLVDEPRLRESLAASGRTQIVELFGVERVVEQLAELYRVEH